ncbi:hypothetical protein HDE_02304 [Halotydeus destructor]|nr:hypothetical protein HDE_02304 [Halotydeus destructor]
MKIPNGDDHQEEIREANARANRAQEEALALRTKLEAMEALLRDTKGKIVSANEEIDIKDQRLKTIAAETKLLAGNVHLLEDRFQNLKKLQGEMHEKREALFGPDKPIEQLVQELSGLEQIKSEAVEAPKEQQPN